jgi:hypothetical protein
MLTGDVPSQHLMRPVYSAGRRRQGSSCRRRACQVCYQTVRLCYAAHYEYRPLYKKHPWHAEDTQISGVRAQEDCPSSEHVGAQYLCACPPSAIKGEACDVRTQVHSDSQASTAIQHIVE